LNGWHDDVLGGLEISVNIANERAGIPKDHDITIIEMLKKGLIDFSMFMLKLFSIESKIATDPTVELLKFRIRYNGEPLPMPHMEDLVMMNLQKK